MYQKTFYLKDLDEKFKDSDAYFVYYRLENKSDMMDDIVRPGMVVVPGGGYQFTSDREGEPIALSYLIEGFYCFVLKYTTNAKYPTPHSELAFTLDYVNAHYKEFQIFENKTSIVGFSAGGHLVTSYGYTYPEQTEELSLDIKRTRPFSIVSCYAVTKAEMPTHEGTIDTITGLNKELLKKLDVPKNIDASYPPTFVFSTYSDQAVPVVSSLELLESLKKNNVRNDSIIFEKGVHGGSTFTRGVNREMPDYEDVKNNYVWLHKSADFIYKLLEE